MPPGYWPGPRLARRSRTYGKRRTSPHTPHVVVTFPRATRTRQFFPGTRNAWHFRQYRRLYARGRRTLYRIPIFAARPAYRFARVWFPLDASRSARRKGLSILSWAIFRSDPFRRRWGIRWAPGGAAKRVPAPPVAPGRPNLFPARHHRRRGNP